MKKTGLSRSNGSMTKVIARPMAPVPPVIASAVAYWGVTVKRVEGKHSVRILL